MDDNNDTLKKHLIDLTSRITGFDIDVIIEYLKIKENGFNIISNISVQDIYGKYHTNNYEKLINDLTHIEKSLKINKIINK